MQTDCSVWGFRGGGGAGREEDSEIFREYTTNPTPIFFYLYFSGILIYLLSSADFPISQHKTIFRNNTHHFSSTYYIPDTEGIKCFTKYLLIFATTFGCRYFISILSKFKLRFKKVKYLIPGWGRQLLKWHQFLLPGIHVLM